MAEEKHEHTEYTDKDGKPDGSSDTKEVKDEPGIVEIAGKSLGLGGSSDDD